MLLVTISNNEAKFMIMYPYGEAFHVAISTPRKEHAAKEALAELVRMGLDFEGFTILPAINCPAEIQLEDDVIGILSRDDDDPHELMEDPETFYVKVSEYKSGTVFCP